MKLLRKIADYFRAFRRLAAQADEIAAIRIMLADDKAALQDVLGTLAWTRTQLDTKHAALEQAQTELHTSREAHRLAMRHAGELNDKANAAAKTNHELGTALEEANQALADYEDMRAAIHFLASEFPEMQEKNRVLDAAKWLSEHTKGLLEEIRLLAQDLATCRATQNRLHRRCQEAESAGFEWEKFSKATLRQKTGKYWPALMRHSLTMAHQTVLVCYMLARHVRNTDKMPPLEWGVKGTDLLSLLRGIHPDHYDECVKGERPDLDTAFEQLKIDEDARLSALGEPPQSEAVVIAPPEKDSGFDDPSLAAAAVISHTAAVAAACACQPQGGCHHG